MNINIPVIYNERGQLKSPLISALNDINQDSKKIGDKYLIHLDKEKILYSDKRKGVVGTHVSTITADKVLTVLKESFGEAILEINTDAINVLLKTFKKNMVRVIVYGETNKLVVLLDDGAGFDIGRYIHISNPIYEIMDNAFNSMMDTHGKIISNENLFKVLPDEAVNSIMESIFKCNINDVHVRITKQLVPGINNKFEVSLFLDTENVITVGVDQACTLYLKQDRKSVTHYHMYKIIKY